MGISIDKAVTNGGGMPTISADLNLPVDVGVDYSIFLEINTGIVYFAKLGAWVPISGGGGYLSLQQVTNTGNTSYNDIIVIVGSTATSVSIGYVECVNAAGGKADILSDNGVNGGGFKMKQIGSAFEGYLQIDATLLTADRRWKFPNADGTVALTADAFLQPHLKQTSGPAPTITLGAGAGAGATIALTNCTDTSGRVLITTGAVPVVNVEIFRVTFGTAMVNAPTGHLSPSNAAAGALVKTAMPFQVYSAVDTAKCVFNSNQNLLTPATQYSFNYLITA